MGSTAILQILIKARDEASRVLEGVGASANTLGLALAGIGAAGVGMATAMTLTAARTEELGLMVNKMAEVHGVATEEIARTEQAVKNLGIRTQVTRLLMTQLMATQIDLTYATRIARAAQDLATLGQVESSEAVADLAYAIASLQPRLLRKYRIYVSLVKVYRDAASALGKTIEELTIAERRHAFLNAVLQEAAQYTGLYEEKMKTASGQLRSMPRYIQEVANALGQVYVPAVRDAIMVTGEFLMTIAKMEGVAPDAIGLIIGMAGSFAALSSIGILLAPRLVQIAEGLTALSIAAGIAGASILGTIVAFAAIITVIGGAIVAWRRYEDVVAKGAETVREAGLKTGKSYDEMARAMRQAYTAMPLWKQMILDMTGGMYGWIDKIIGTREEWEKLMQVFRMSKVTIQDLFPAFYGLADAAVSSANIVIEAFGQAFFSMAAFFGDTTRAAQDFQSDMLTNRRRYEYVMNEIQTRGWTERLDNEAQSLNEQAAQLEKGYEKQRIQMQKQLGMMLIAQIQAADLGVETATRMSLAIGEAYDIFMPADVTKALALFAPIFALKKGQIGEEAATRQLIGAAGTIGGYQHGGIIPGPIGQPRLIMAHGGEEVTPVGAGGGITITIGALYGTDRLAATRFGRQLAKEIRAQGVRTR